MAGNGAKDTSTFSPGNNPNVIAVSAIADSDGICGAEGESTSAGADDSLASFSNYGSTIDMAAPGVQIYSTSKNGGYSIMSGTSMAAPHVASAAALYMSQNPNSSPSQVFGALKSKASTSSNECDTKVHGYFTNDKDSSKEPLLYVDNLIGTNNADTIDGRGGNDQIQGLAGDDRVIQNLQCVNGLKGAGGNDIISGGDGSDCVMGGGR